MGANWSESRPDFSSLEEEDVSDDEDLVESSDDLMATGSLESNDSGVSLKSDRSKAELLDFKDRVFLRPDFSSSEEEDVSDDEDLVESPDDQMAKGSRLSIESFDSGVSFKSDWSRDGLIDFRGGVSPSRLDLSSFEKKRDVSDDEDLVESPDDLRIVKRRSLSEPAKSDFHIPLRQQSPLMMAHSSVEAFGSGLTLMNDSFIRPRQRSLPRRAKRCMKAFDSGVSSKRVWSKRGLIDFNESSLPREEMNQELSSEVGWKHG